MSVTAVLSPDATPPGGTVERSVDRVAGAQTAATPDDPAAGWPSPPRRARALVIAGTVLTVLGALLVGFAAFELWVTDLSEQRSQEDLVAEFRQLLFAATAGEVDPGADAGFGEFRDVLAEEEASAGPEVITYEPPAKGSATAILRIPALGLEKVVVEGTGAVQLKAGPGRYRAGPLPGQPGNAIIVGRRTTYGGPFRHLDELEAGDPVEVLTPQGIFTYRVTERAIVRPGDPDVLQQGEVNQLTLVTAHPEFQASNRLVVRAELVGDPVRPSEQELDARRRGLTVPLTPDEDGVTGDAGGWVWVVVWGQLLAVAIVVARRLYRSWQRWPTWLLTTPVILALAFLLFESIDRLLPSTL